MCNLSDIFPLANLAHGGRFIEPARTEVSLATLFGRTIYLCNHANAMGGIAERYQPPRGYYTQDYIRAHTQERLDRNAL